MSQTILIENNLDLKKTFSQTLDTFIGSEFIHQKTAEDTIGLLKILPHVTLIITRNKIGEEDTAFKLFEYISNEALPISLIVLGDCPELAGLVHIINEPINLDLLVHQTIETLGLFNESPQEYVPVGLHYFYEMEKLPCDVFIRIKAEPNYKFIKRIHAMDTFDRLSIDRYAENGLQEFYISKDELENLQYFVTRELISKLSRYDLPAQEMILATASAHQIVREVVNSTGLDTNSIELSEASIKSMMDSMLYSPNVVSDLNFILSESMPLAYQLSHLKSLMCHFALSRQKWYRRKHLETVCFVSFFYDITLSDRDLKRYLYFADKNKLMSRPAQLVGIIELHPMMDSMSRTIITQSVGSKDGTEWVENPAEDLHVLSKIFIVAECFVKILLNPNEPSIKRDILTLLFMKFENPSYQKIIKSLGQKLQSS